MSIFEFAMQMELDGEKFYRGIAAKTGNPGLKKIFISLADDEAEHYRVFKGIKECSTLDSKASTILEDSKNIFAEMKDAGKFDIDTDADQKKAYEAALDMEKKSYTFYDEKAVLAENQKEKSLLQAIAREERHHYRLLEGIIDFVAQPETWLEDAEFVHLTEY